MTQELRSLYEITGDIKDINTVLVQRDRLEKAEKDAHRYQVLRNPPYSDNWGDVYAMTFQRTGDMPLKEEELDVAVDRLICAAMEASK